MTRSFEEMGVELRAGEKAGQACAIISGRHVSSFRVSLPALSPRKLQRTIGYFMSDRLASENADLSFCVCPTETAGESLVLVCARPLLLELVQRARADNITLTAIWPDYMGLAAPPEGVVIARRDGDIIARRADGTGFTMPEMLADLALENLEPGEADLATWPDANPGFATGAFGPQLPIADYLSAWRRVAALAFIGLGLWVGLSVSQAVMDNRQRLALLDRGEALFRRQFPDVRRVVNVEGQLRARLGQPVLSEGFLSLSSSVFESLAALDNIRLEAVRYSADRPEPLQISVAGKSFADIEQARQTLVNAGFSVSDGDSEQTGSGVVARFGLVREDL